MSRRAYLFFGQVIGPLHILGLKIFTKITRRPRVRVIVTNEKHEVLLQRGVISHGKWSLPGGGINRGESAVAAARRELLEETGIDVAESQLTYIRTLKRPNEDIPFTAPLFKVQVDCAELPETLYNPHEIIAVSWFGLDELPDTISPVAQLGVNELK